MINVNKYKYPLMESQCDGDYVQNMGWTGGHEDDLGSHWRKHILDDAKA